MRHNAFVSAVAFSPDGLIALSASADRTIQLWDTTTHRPIGMPLRHQAAVLDATFSPDGRTVLSGSADRFARLWSIPEPVEAEIERIALWAQVITGAELDGGDVMHILHAAAWNERRQRLDELAVSPRIPSVPLHR
jgi:WD40 repeat protein